MPLLLLLLGVTTIGGLGGYLVAKKTSKELEAKKAYAECVKELTNKIHNPREAASLCIYSNPTLDLSKLLLLTASVTATLLAVNFILGRKQNATNPTKVSS